MAYQIAADLVVAIHFIFVFFVVLGGLLAIWWPRMCLVHLPAAIWGALIEFMGWICPLTPLEISLRQVAGDEGYSGGFFEHYIIPLIYPDELTRGMQFAIGAFVVIVNVAVYGVVLFRFIQSRSTINLKQNIKDCLRGITNRMDRWIGS
jgi:hypothetical protein